jgi:toxin secretion/phage lysis holin
MTRISTPAVLKWSAAVIAAEWLRMPGVVKALIYFIAVDYATGVLAAVIRRELASYIAWRGLLRKTLVLLMLLAAHVGEAVAGTQLNIDHILAVAYVVTEVISIIENCARAGVPIPSQIVVMLLAAKKLHHEATPEQLRELEQ